jgi:uncharacterized lipoprotein YmbA
VTGVSSLRWLLGWLILAAGCRTVLPRSERSEFFLLTPVDAGAAAPAAGAPSVLLGPVVLPEYLQRRELVTRVGANQVREEELELWAEPLRDSLPRTLERDLAALLGRGRIRRGPWTGQTPPELAIAVDIRRFERTSGGQVELVADWAVSDGTAASERLHQQTRLILPAGKTTQAAVASLSRALAMLSREIAQGIEQVAGAPAPPRAAVR